MKKLILLILMLAIAGCGSVGSGLPPYVEPEYVVIPTRESMYGTFIMTSVWRWDPTGTFLRCGGRCGGLVVSPTESVWTLEDFGWSEVTPTIEVWPGELVYAPLQSDFWYLYVDDDDYRIIFYEKRVGFWIHYYLMKVSDEY